MLGRVAIKQDIAGIRMDDKGGIFGVFRVGRRADQRKGAQHHNKLGNGASAQARQ